MVSTATAKAAVSIRSCCGVDDFMSGLHDALAAQQAARAHEQDDHGDQIDDDLVDAGDDALDLVHRREGLQDAEQKAGGQERKNTRLNSSHKCASRMPSSACTNTKTNK